jgi:hypothetical protein
MGLGLVAATLGLLGAGAGSPGSTRYELVAPLLSVGGGPVYACFSYDLMGDGCGGVPVRGIDIRQIPTVQGYADSPTLETPPVRLVGRWEHGELTLTEPPQPGGAARSSPDLCNQPIGSQPSAGAEALQDRVVRDPAFGNGKILFLESMPCEGNLELLVAVADPETVSYLQSRYPGVVVTGWLQPISG